jgi:DNA invertase Pin-like site-specific DNA recombinase
MTPHRGKFVAYFRVSTDKQGKSGLGLEAQREAVFAYLNGGSWSLVQNLWRLRAGSTAIGHSSQPRLRRAKSTAPSWSLPSWTAYRGIWRSLPR